jgi:DNA-binding winged helix-turn-helix (wHTH) protein
LISILPPARPERRSALADFQLCQLPISCQSAVRRKAGEVVIEDELMEQIGPGAIVTENTPHVHAMAVRKALGLYRCSLKTELCRGFHLLGD